MFGLPKDFDGSIFLSRTLEQICLNENTIYFHFDRGIFISVESAYSYFEADLVSDDQLTEVPKFDANVLRLLGKSIRRATGSSDGTLSLVFETGQMLKIFDTSDQYESYKMDFDNKTIIV